MYCHADRLARLIGIHLNEPGIVDEAALSFGFAPGDRLNDAGGMLQITRGSERRCLGEFCDPTFDAEALRFVTGGSLVGTLIPIPAALWLLASGLGLLGCLKRKLA